MHLHPPPYLPPPPPRARVDGVARILSLPIPDTPPPRPPRGSAGPAPLGASRTYGQPSTSGSEAMRGREHDDEVEIVETKKRKKT